MNQILNELRINNVYDYELDNDCIYIYNYYDNAIKISRNEIKLYNYYLNKIKIFKMNSLEEIRKILYESLRMTLISICEQLKNIEYRQMKLNEFEFIYNQKIFVLYYDIDNKIYSLKCDNLNIEYNNNETDIFYKKNILFVDKIYNYFKKNIYFNKGFDINHIYKIIIKEDIKRVFEDNKKIEANIEKEYEILLNKNYSFWKKLKNMIISYGNITILYMSFLKIFK